MIQPMRPVEPPERMWFGFKCILFPVFLFIMIIMLIFFTTMYVQTLEPELVDAYDEFDTGNPAGNAVKAPSIWRAISGVGFVLIGLGICYGCIDFVLSYKDWSNTRQGF